MSQRVRFGILIGLVGLALAVFGIFFLNRMFRQTLAAPLPQTTPEQPLTQQVVITTHNVTLGTVLKAEDLRLADMPVELVPPGALNDMAAVIGKFSKVDLVSGEMVLDHHLADPTNVSHDVAYVIEDYKVLMAFPASDLMSTLNVIQRGDLVDIFVTVNQEVNKSPQSAAGVSSQEETVTEAFTFDAMQRIEISAMVVDVVNQNQRQSPLPSESEVQPTPGPQEGKVKAYLLALSAQDALVLKHLKDEGANFDIVLRAPTSNQLFDLNPVTTQYLNDRYQLESDR